MGSLACTSSTLASCGHFFVHQVCCQSAIGNSNQWSTRISRKNLLTLMESADRSDACPFQAIPSPFLKPKWKLLSVESKTLRNLDMNAPTGR